MPRKGAYYGPRRIPRSTTPANMGTWNKAWGRESAYLSTVHSKFNKAKVLTPDELKTKCVALFEGAMGPDDRWAYEKAVWKDARNYGSKDPVKHHKIQRRVHYYNALLRRRDHLKYWFSHYSKFWTHLHHLSQCLHDISALATYLNTHYSKSGTRKPKGYGWSGIKRSKTFTAPSTLHKEAEEDTDEEALLPDEEGVELD